MSVDASGPSPSGAGSPFASPALGLGAAAPLTRASRVAEARGIARSRQRRRRRCARCASGGRSEEVDRLFTASLRAHGHGDGWLRQRHDNTPALNALDDGDRPVERVAVLAGDVDAALRCLYEELAGVTRPQSVALQDAEDG